MDVEDLPPNVLVGASHDAREIVVALETILRDGAEFTHFSRIVGAPHAGRIFSIGEHPGFIKLRESLCAERAARALIELREEVQYPEYIEGTYKGWAIMSTQLHGMRAAIAWTARIFPGSRPIFRRVSR